MNMRSKIIKDLLRGLLICAAFVIVFCSGRFVEKVFHDEEQLSRLYFTMKDWQSGEILVEQYFGSMKYQVRYQREAMRAQEWLINFIPFFGKRIVRDRDDKAAAAEELIEQAQLK